MAVTVCKILMEHVQDTASIEAAMTNENFGADDIIAIVAKTEGNGGVNDFGRILVDRMLRDFLVAKGSRGREGAMSVPIALSGGCPGIIAPHLNIFANVEDSDPDPEAERLAVEKVAAGTKLAMVDAGIDNPADIHYVQSKSPLLTTESIYDAKSRGFSVCTEETIESMSFANATAALGIGVALGEIAMPREDQVGRDLDLYSSVASCSSGNEQNEAQIVVVGNKKGAGGRFRIGHSVMKDAIDTDGIYEAIRNAGLPLSDRPHPSDLGDAVVNCFVKCETDSRGLLRGHRLVSLNDTDVHHTHQTKAAVGGVAAAAIGDPAVFVSVAALQQGPAGGGMVAAIVDMDKIST